MAGEAGLLDFTMLTTYIHTYVLKIMNDFDGKSASKNQVFHKAHFGGVSLH